MGVEGATGLRIAALGDRDPGLLTHREIDATLALMGDDVQAGWLGTDDPRARSLQSFDGVWLLPGTPYRDDAVAYAAVEFCLRAGVPFLGTCGGFQYACVQLMRSLAGIEDAAHAETDPSASTLAVVALECSLYGVHRTVNPVKRTRLAAICGDQPFPGFHFCGFGLAEEAAQQLTHAGVTVSAWADDAGTEAIELAEHPFFIATAFQPQVGSGESGQLASLIDAFLTAARARAAAQPGAGAAMRTPA